MTSPIRTAHDGLELPAIGFVTYRVQGLDGLAAIGYALENGYLLCSRLFRRSRARSRLCPRPFRRGRAWSRLCSRPFRRGRAQGHPHSLARMQIYSVI